MENKINVLMTGAGAPGGPGIIRAIKMDSSINLWVADADELATGRFLNEQFVHIPSARENKFIDVILNFCIKEKINVVFPLVTLELFEFSKNKAKFLKHGIKVIVSDWEYLSISNDKSKLVQHLKNNNVVVPDFYVIKNLIELNEACKLLGYPSKSVVIKPSVSNGSRGVRVLNSSIDEYNSLFNQKPNNLYSNLEKINTILHKKEFPEILVSEYLPGDEFTIDTIVNNGEVKIVIPRLRRKMNGGISVSGQFINDPLIIEYCKLILGTMKLNGPIGIQVKIDVNGNYKILEINPRIQGTSVAALGIGVNLPLIAIHQCFSDKDYSNIDINWNIGFSRFYSEVFYEI